MSQRLTVVIADDEPRAREKLIRLLRAHADIELVAEARTGREAVEAVRRHRPDLLLLDIRMPELDGFQALAVLDKALMPQVVFVTAFDEYAIRAFDVRAIDYLLKPYDAERLGETLDRVRERASSERRTEPDAIGSVLGDLKKESDAEGSLEPGDGRYVERLCVRSPGRMQVVRLADVEWIEACGNYVRLHSNGSRPLLREPMRRLLEQLDPARFARIHRGAIVNLDRVREMKPTVSGDYIVTLESGMRLKMSRSFRAAMQSRLSGRR